MDRDSGRYQLETLIARGGMGEIWRARLSGAAGFEKVVVVKRLLEHLEDDPDFLARFLDEARIAATLTHRNVVAVLDVGYEDGSPFLAMEWVDGWDLRRLIQVAREADELLPLRVALHIAAELSAALAYAHDKRDDDGAPLHIVHRDVSPANVLLSRSGEVKLTDFGIASARRRLGRTVTGQLRGKFAYMSPEQAIGGAVDRRSDVFAVGALLFELTTGVRPFEGDGDLETLARVQAADRPDPRSLRADLPDALAEIIDRALEREPARRFSDAGELEDALREVLATLGGPFTTRAFADWLDGTIPASEGSRSSATSSTSAGRRAQAATVDDLLLAQLNGDEPISRDGRDDSGTGKMRRQSASSSQPVDTARRSHTLTRSVAPTDRPRPRRWPARSKTMLIALAALAVAAAAVASVGRSGRLLVTSVPAGATVYVDGVQAGVTSLDTRTALGEREVTLRLDGHEPAVYTVDVTRREQARVIAHLDPVDIAVAFHSVPVGADVTVGEQRIHAGNTARVPIGVPVRVQMALDGHRAIDEQVEFTPGDTIFTRRLTPLPASVTAPRVAERPDETSEEVESRADDEPVAAARGDRPSTSPPPRGQDSTPAAASRAGTPTTPPSTSDAGEASRASVVLRFVAPPMVGDIRVNGDELGASRDLRHRLELSAGTHRIEVENAQLGARFAATITLAAGDDRTLNVDWQPTAP